MRELPRPDFRNVERGVCDLALTIRLVEQGFTDEIEADLRARWPNEDWQAMRRDWQRLHALRAPAKPADKPPSIKRAPVPRVERQFASVHEKAEFYRDLFSRE